MEISNRLSISSARADTIYALSTARGRAGIAVVRVSGPASVAALEAIAGRAPEPRIARLARLVDPCTGELIDQALVLRFAGPASETGEDMAEFQVHGGPAIVSALLEALSAVPGCRPAGPGEFTRRAFENGKLDLSAAEGLADLVAADTAAQRRQALRQAGGAFARLTEGWAARLSRALAHVEAAVDFADEELPPGLLAEARAEAAALAAEIRRHLADGRRGEILRDGLSVAIVGPPNSGKSSLLNLLAGRDAAIVSAIAGTTRDVIEVRLDLGGYPVILADTAGIRESEDPIEAEGIRRARDRAASADLSLLVLDAASEASQGVTGLDPTRTITVLNKLDLVPPDRLQAEMAERPGAIALSARSGEGLDRLVVELTRRAEATFAGEAPVVTRQRHRLALEECAAALERAARVPELALAAEDLRFGLRALGCITGRVDVEDLLDLVFRDFCIGK